MVCPYCSRCYFATSLIYADDSFYHVYNRGVEKRKIFQDEQDYKVFLNYLKEYLSPPIEPEKLKTSFILQRQSFKGIPRQCKNYHNEVTLHAYCLMPNHFHLLIHQRDKGSLEKFTRSLLTRFSKYFNKKNDRVGPLFQGRYKAVMVNKDNYLLHLSRYIHRNPQENCNDIVKAYSSYPEYLGLQKTSWVKPNIILNFFNQHTSIEFKKTNSYKKFVENYEDDSESILGMLTLDSE